MSEQPFELEVPNMSVDLQQILEDATADKKIRLLRYMAQETSDYLKFISEQVKDVENFWPFALYAHIVIKQAASVKADRQALSYLTNVELLQDANDPRPYELIFHFKENPFFSNASLSRKFSLPDGVAKAADDGSITDEMRGFDPEDLVSTPITIDWKDNLCEKYPRKKPEGEDGFDGDYGSFFHFFTDAADPFSLGPILQQDLLPDIYEYFRGEGENCDLGEGFDSDEDEEDELDDDDDEEIDLEAPQPKKKQKTH